MTYDFIPGPVVRAAANAMLPYLSEDDAAYRELMAEVGLKAGLAELARIRATAGKKGLTARQITCLDVIKAHISKHKESPSFRDIADAMNVTSSNIHRIVHALEARGHIAMIPGHARSITVL